MSNRKIHVPYAGGAGYVEYELADIKQVRKTEDGGVSIENTYGDVENYPALKPAELLYLVLSALELQKQQYVNALS